MKQFLQRILLVAMLGVVFHAQATDYYTASGDPATGSALSSSVLRSEYSAIGLGFSKIAPYTSNGGKLIGINAGGTAQTALTTGTGIATALAVNVGTAGSFVVNGGALGSPSSAGTIPAFTLGGTVSGGGNQINNVIIGTSTPLAGTFTTLTPTGLLDASGAGAGQIKFPASQNASSNANTLDDYEEGTWTPSVGGSATYTQQGGAYTKIGRQVTCWFDMEINAIGTGSTSVISGLPFTRSSSTAVQGNGVTIGYFTSLAISVYSLYLRVDASATTIINGVMTASGTGVTGGAAIYGNGSRVTGSVTYYTD